MSLSIGYFQQSLHQCSQTRIRALQQQVGVRTGASPHARTTTKTTTSHKNQSIPNPALFSGLTSNYDSLENTSETSIDADAAARSLSSPSSSKTARQESPAITSLDLGIDIPTIPECAVHLELLLCFEALHRHVDNSASLDKAFSIIARPRIVRRYRGPDKKVKDPTFDTRRKLKWPAVLNIAVRRFLIWIEKIDAALDGVPRREWHTFFPPPIDVLMVWHAVLLNPSYYKRLTKDLKQISGVGFPWAEIYAAIDTENQHFNLSTSAKTNFQKMTGLDPDIFEDIKRHSTYKPVALRLARTIEPKLTTPEIVKLDNITNTEEPFPDGPLSALYDSPSPEVTEAASAVTRQYAFCQKMVLQLWLRSPVALDIVTRSRIRYARFLKLFRLYPKTMLVPTLDIDLVWHTHQLSHQRYVTAMKAVTGTFIDHDDKIEKPTLTDGMQRTADLYQIRFGAVYQACNCWECETLTSALEKATLAAKGGEINEAAIQAKVIEDVDHYRLVELSRRAGKPAPARK